MKPIHSQPIVVIICTLVCLTLLTLNIVYLPRHFELPTQYIFNNSGKDTSGKHPPLLDGGELESLVSLPYSTWLQQPSRLTLISLHSPPHFDIETTFISPSTQTVLISGSWRNSLISLGAGSLNLSSAVTFTSPLPVAMDEISPSTNGYLNSRIDLRRKRHVFAGASDVLVHPPIRLQLREDAVLQFRNVQPLVHRHEFERMLTRNRRLEEVSNAPKLRKAKKKQNVKVNSTR